MAQPSIKPSVAGDIPRGNAVKFTIENLPPDSTIRRWIFEEPKRASVRRKEGEDKPNWQKSWEGKIVASGKIVVRYEIKKKVSVNPKKTKWKATQWNKNPPVEQEIKVVPRTGNDWSSTVVEHPEQPTSQMPGNQPLIPPIQFRDLGKHDAQIRFGNILTETISSGPNSGYKFVTALGNTTLESYCYINDDLLDPNSKFSKAQDGNVYFTMGGSPQLHLVKNWQEYFGIQGKEIKLENKEKFFKDHNIPVNIVEPEPVREIDSNDWVLSADTITIKDEQRFRDKYKIGKNAYKLEAVKYNVYFPRISHDKLLAHTRRHEYQGQVHSHRANFKKAVRGLDPKAYAESLIARPKENIDFRKEIDNRINLISEASGTHRIIDEVRTKTSGKLEIDTASGEMLGATQDDKGAMVGIVWDPTNDRAFPDSTSE